MIPPVGDEEYLIAYYQLNDFTIYDQDGKAVGTTHDVIPSPDRYVLPEFDDTHLPTTAPITRLPTVLPSMSGEIVFIAAEKVVTENINSNEIGSIIAQLSSIYDVAQSDMRVESEYICKGEFVASLPGISFIPTSGSFLRIFF